MTAIQLHTSEWLHLFFMHFCVDGNGAVPPHQSRKSHLSMSAQAWAVPCCLQRSCPFAESLELS